MVTLAKDDYYYLVDIPVSFFLQSFQPLPLRSVKKVKVVAWAQ